MCVSGDRGNILVPAPTAHLVITYCQLSSLIRRQRSTTCREDEKLPTCNVSPSPSMMVPLSWNHWTLSYLTWVLRKVHIRIRFGGPTSSSSTVAHKTVLTQVPHSICVGCLSSISALSAIVFNSGTSKSKSEMASVVC